MSTITSRDGTTIAFERSGDGPALVLVDGAMCHRGFGPMPPLAQALAGDFTVYTYDRRGRNESGDTQPFAVEREIEDLEALVAEAGGSARVFGISSGGALAMEAAASGVAIEKLAIYEAPYSAEAGDPQAVADYTRQLSELLAAGRKGDAVALFMGFVGAPPDAVAGMRQSPMWPAFEAIAPTLAYDNATMNGGKVPRERAAKVAVPTLVADGGDSPELLRQPARVLAEVIPGAAHRTLEGQTHEVEIDALAPVLREFLA